jgi:hypothetical protein
MAFAVKDAARLSLPPTPNEAGSNNDAAGFA